MLRACKRAAALALLIVLPVVVAQVFVGKLLTDHPARAAELAATFVLLVVIVTKPGAILVMALPATYLYYRVGPASTDISLADVSLGVALIAALPFVPWRAPTMRSMFRVLGVYLLILAIPVVAVFSQRSLVEWGHRSFLVAGGILVGAAIAATGRTVAALRAYLAASGVVAVAAVLDALGHLARGDGFAPAYPFGIHKNSAGFLLAVALLTLIILPNMLKLARPTRTAAMTGLFLGIAACQARGSALTLVVVVVVWAIKEDKVRLSPLAIVGATLLVIMSYVAVDAAFRADQPSAQFNSVNSRISTYDASLRLWRSAPTVGAGLKYWRNPQFAGELAFGEPHDLVVSALGESGVIGLAALGCLVLGTIAVIARSRSQLATFAALLVTAKTVDSVVGIFWVAGTLTIAWIVVGMASATDETLVAAESPANRERSASRFR